MVKSTGMSTIAVRSMPALTPPATTPTVAAMNSRWKAKASQPLEMSPKRSEIVESNPPISAMPA